MFHCLNEWSVSLFYRQLKSTVAVDYSIQTLFREFRWLLDVTYLIEIEWRSLCILHSSLTSLSK